MREEHKRVKRTLESWGNYKRRSLGALGYPKESTAFNPENYEYNYGAPPSWNRKRIPQGEEFKYRQARQQSTRPAMKPRIPNYIGNSWMNYVDNLLKYLPDMYQEVAVKKFVEQMTNEEIALAVCRTVRTVEARTEKLYKLLSDEIDWSELRKRKPQQNHSSM